MPTPAGWFEAFQRDFGLQIPLDTQKSLTLGLGGSGGPNYVPLDPNQTFVNITGCSLQGAVGCSDEPAGGLQHQLPQHGAHPRTFQPVRRQHDGAMRQRLQAAPGRPARGRGRDPRDALLLRGR